MNTGSGGTAGIQRCSVSVFPPARARRLLAYSRPGSNCSFRPATNVEQRPDFWIANRLNYNNANRNTFGLRPVGRLKPGVALARAQEEADAVSAHIREQFPVSKGSGFHARLEPMHKTLVEEVRPAILALMGAVIFLLLIACANVANLLLVRSSLRQPELAVRAALGAGRGRVIRQMLAEAVVLTALGAAGGVALAWIGIRELLSIAPANLPRLETIRIDPIVLLFTLAIALAAAFLFGMVPAWSAFRMDLVNALGGAARTSGLRGGGRLFRNAVVVIEVALCFVLLVGSGLMIRSFLELQRIDPGYDPRGLLTFQLLGGGPVTQRARRGEGAPARGAAARDSRRAERHGVVPVSARRWLQHHQVGTGRRADRHFEVSGRGLAGRSPGLLRNDAHAAGGGEDIHRG